MSLTKKLQEMMGLFDEIKREVEERDPHLYERWKASGFAVDGGFVSMYPAIEEVVEQLGDEEDEDEDEE